MQSCIIFVSKFALFAVLGMPPTVFDSWNTLAWMKWPEKCADSSRFSSNPGEALREIQNVKSAATVGDLSLQLSKCWIKHCHEKIEARENKNTAMWKERLSNMNGEARLSWNLATFEVQYPTSCESIRWFAGASLETTVPSASFSIQIGFGAASGAKISHDFACWNCRWLTWLRMVKGLRWKSCSWLMQPSCSAYRPSTR